jgi:hypothetical protein
LTRRTGRKKQTEGTVNDYHASSVPVKSSRTLRWKFKPIRGRWAWQGFIEGKHTATVTEDGRTICPAGAKLHDDDPGLGHWEQFARCATLLEASSVFELAELEKEKEFNRARRRKSVKKREEAPR